MFAYCKNLSTINRGFTIPPNVTNIKTIFKESKEITGLPASLFSKEYLSEFTYDLNSMFKDYTKLTTI
jgi:hypothetical protein